MDFYAEGQPVLNEGGEVEEDSLVIYDDDSEVRLVVFRHTDHDAQI